MLTYDHTEEEINVINSISNQIATIYKIDVDEITKMGSRKHDIIEARRMFIYYLFKEKNIRHYKMYKYVKGIDHSTSIYHCRKIEELFSIDNNLKIKYIELLYLCDNESFFKLNKNPLFSEMISKVLKIIK
tara:strand:+ start:183 stop:575 length:393 start_codon:yes stop_codon:yes gene_type:complete